MEGGSSILRWSKRILHTGGLQVAVQGIGFLSGLLVIRRLTTEEYSFYTIANSVLGMMSVLTDGGIGLAVMAQGGRVWQDDERLGGILAAGLRLRRQFAGASLLVAIPIMGVLLRRQGASWPVVGLLMGAVLLLFSATLTNQLLEIIPRLRQQISRLQRIQIASATLRLCLLGLAVLVVPRAWGAVLAASLAIVWANLRMRRWISETMSYHGRGDQR